VIHLLHLGHKVRRKQVNLNAALTKALDPLTTDSLIGVEHVAIESKVTGTHIPPSCATCIGQMDMYVRMMDELKRGPDDNPTVGIILCAQKDSSVVRYSVLHENEQLFASRYKLVLPSEDELRDELDRERAKLEPETSNGDAH
jgi:hypothetical protein